MKLINLRGSEVLPSWKAEITHKGRVIGIGIEDKGFNKAVSTIEQVCVEVSLGELTAILREYFPCDHHAAQNCRCDLKWAKCANALNESKQKWLKLERVEERNV